MQAYQLFAKSGFFVTGDWAMPAFADESNPRRTISACSKRLPIARKRVRDKTGAL
jgi:hypothetical protein